MNKIRNKPVIGVMGPIDEFASEADIMNASELGRFLAKKDCILLSGGRDTGVMRAVNEGYDENNGICSVGINPFATRVGMNENVDVCINTNMGSGRNHINALSSQVMIAVGDMSDAGTLSEVALSIAKYKAIRREIPYVKEKKVIILGEGEHVEALVKAYPKNICVCDTPESAIETAIQELGIIT